MKSQLCIYSVYVSKFTCWLLVLPLNMLWCLSLFHPTFVCRDVTSLYSAVGSGALMFNATEPAYTSLCWGCSSTQGTFHAIPLLYILSQFTENFCASCTNIIDSSLYPFEWSHLSNMHDELIRSCRHATGTRVLAHTSTVVHYEGR